MKDHQFKAETRLSRRTFMASAAVVTSAAILTRPAGAAEFTYKLATGQSLTQPINTRLEQAVGRINQASGGRLEIRFFPASQLGSDTDLLTQIRSGGVDFLNIAGSVLSTVASVAGIANVGFAFSDYGQVWKALDGDLGKLIASQVEKTGALVVAKPADNTFRQITSTSKPIRTADDLERAGVHLAVSTPMRRLKRVTRVAALRARRVVGLRNERRMLRRTARGPCPVTSVDLGRFAAQTRPFT